MKKFLAVLAIAGTLVACDNAGTSTTKEDSARIADSIKRVEDSIKASMPVVVDTPAVKIVDTPAVKLDTPKVN